MVSGLAPSIIAEIQRQSDRNRRVTIVLAVVAIINVALIGMIVGAVVGDPVVLLLALGMIGAWLACAYFFFNATVLRATRARSLRANEDRRIRTMVQRLSATLNVPMPRLMVIDDEAFNAFAVGSGDKAAVVFSTGLLSVLTDDELEGVTAHELAHVANGDTRIALLSAAMLGWAVFVSAVVTIIAIALAIFGVGMVAASGDNRDAKDWTDALAGFFAKLFIGLGLIAAAIIGWLVGQAWFMISQITHLGISRQREWLADATAAQITGKPLALASALEKALGTQTQLGSGNGLARSLCVVAPPRSGQWWRDLFDTHPNIYERIARLRGFAGRTYAR